VSREEAVSVVSGAASAEPSGAVEGVVAGWLDEQPTNSRPRRRGRRTLEVFMSRDITFSKKAVVLGAS
jgi:hypothetical protein